ncbi:T9SS type A sorting domain-containing protein [Flavobacterium silvisoli]|uniref:T9SS type A sorting domain-containing protein n=1 Tax=Flavobacterium silvisoli TaxID=2529433 RepID=A0A4Q9Z1Q4_9FLAO|nr:T9SS type A sorting domain-containing protein [Flavobacterium silvisoli]TBX67689.1 T9SS type A sorting domain-containing protein [Flavobacterium silvisoli]
MRTKLTLIFAFFAFQFSVANAFMTADPVAPSLPPLMYCDSNNDGFGVFNLNNLNSSILAAQSGIAANYVITYHETSLDAEIGSNSIASPYYNISPNIQTVYYRVSDITTNSYAVGSFQLIVNLSPGAIVPNDYHLCDFSGAVGYETFDLTVVIPNVLGTIDPATVSVNFYVDAGLTSQIANPSNYTNSTVWTQTVYVSVLNLATGCYSSVPLNLVVDPLPQLIAPSWPYAVCDDEQDGIAVVDLMPLVPELLNGGSYNVTFHETLTDAQLSGTTIPFPSSYVTINPYYQTIYARGTNPLTGCYTIISIGLQVNPAPMISSLPSVVVCDQDAHPQSGSTLVDLTVRTSNILAVQPLIASQYTVTYYVSQVSAQSNVAPIINPSAYFGVNGQTIWYRVVQNSTGCYNVGNFQLVVNTAPLVTQPSYPPYILYDFGNDGTETFDLTTQISNIVMGQSGCTVFFYPSFADAVNGTNVIYNTSAYTNAPIYVQTLGIKVINASGCYAISTMDIVASQEVPAPNGPFSQNFSEGDTLADLIVSGVDVQWYASANNKMATMSSIQQALPMNTLLVDGTTYYATQTINGVESDSRLPVTVHLILGVNDVEILPVQYAPNPVKNSLNLQSSKLLKSVAIYSILGQKIHEQSCNDTHLMLDMSHMAAGNYILKVQGESGQKTLRIIKE